MRRFQALIITLILFFLPSIAFPGYIYRIGDKVSIGQYSNDFDKAITNIGSDNRVLVIDTSITVTEDVTVPTNVTLEIGRDGYLTYQDANVDLTINGPVMAGPYQWIDPNRNWVTLPQECEKFVQWWGAAGDGSTDDLKPFLRLTEQYGKLTVPYTGSGYKISNEVAINHGNFWLNIEDNITSTNTDPNNMFYIYGDANNFITDIKITGSKITLDGNGSNMIPYTYNSSNPLDCMSIQYAKYVHISGIQFDDGLVNCLRVKDCHKIHIDDCIFTNSQYDNGCSICGGIDRTTDNDPNKGSLAVVSNSVAYDCNDFGFTGFDASFVTFENCTTWNTKGFSGETHTDRKYRVLNYKFNNCQAFNCNDYGFALTAQGCYLDRACKAYNISTSDPNNVEYGCGVMAWRPDEVVIQGTYFNNALHGIYCAEYNTAGASVKITNVSAYGNGGRGVRCKGLQNIIILDCEIKENTSLGIDIDNTASGYDPNDDEAYIINNYVENNGDMGIRSWGVETVIASDNIVIDSPLTTNTAAFSFATMTDLYCYDNTVLDIDPNNALTWGIFVNSTVTNATLSGNKFKGLDAQKVYISGSTTYYDLDTVTRIDAIVWPLVVKNTINPASYTHGAGLKFKFGADSTANKWCGILGVPESNYSTNTGIAFYTATAAAPTEKVRITNTGRVGIGTETPDEMFEIEFDPNTDIEFGRGTTDPNITFFTLTNNGNIKCYVYPDPNGTALVVGPLKP